MHSNVRFYKKTNQIYFSVRLGGLKGVNDSGKISNNSDFLKIKIILLMSTGSQVLKLGVSIDMIISNSETSLITYILSVDWYDKSLFQSFNYI